ncbi:hypothetical protein [Sulfuriroseicoccus oceanibius]|uniref:Uncharacterized protein n=1 Tax=Sulfuriroseicoccus oceanibius TaxID=2707525 RepID=A0A6B3LFA2_9BACT|nr:hypothetical protein [Sulfuriroseicoccus oceanibius]QQL45183.1 hypothetical protein G3M56_000930 [Sulfuriroseicoccus oceanibius]
MSDIFFECSNCEQPLIVGEEGRGQTIECPECAHDVVVPEDAPLVDVDADDLDPAGGEELPEDGVSDAGTLEEDALASIEHVRFGCPTCHQLLEVGLDALGMQLDCPACGHAMMAPSRADVMSANVSEVVAGEEMPADSGGFGYLPPRRELVSSAEDGTVQPTLRRSEWRDDELLKPRMEASTPVGNLPEKKRPSPDRSGSARRTVEVSAEPRMPAPAVREVEAGDAPAEGGRTVRVEPLRRVSDGQEEQERMRAAMGEGDLAVKRVPGTETMVVHCPECHQRYVLNFRMAGSEYVCRGCQSTMMLPRPDQGKAAVLVGQGERPTQAPHRHAHRQRVALPDRKGDGPNESPARDERRPTGPMGGRPSAMLEGGRIPTPAEMRQMAGVVPEVQKPRDFRGAFVVVTVVVVLGSLITWGIASFASRQSAKKPAYQVDPMTGEVVQTSGAAALDKQIADQNADQFKLPSERRREHFERVERTVKEAMAAREPAALLKYCDRPGLVAPKMKAFYARQGGYKSFNKRFGGVTVLLKRRAEYHGREYQLIMATFDGVGAEESDPEILHLAVLLQDGEAKLDWFQLERYSEMSLEELGRALPGEPQEVRATVDVNANYYNFGFLNDDWHSLYLFDPQPGAEATLPVYAQRGTDVFKKLEEIGEKAALRGEKLNALPLTLKVRYEEADGHRGFVVDEVVAGNWLMP